MRSRRVTFHGLIREQCLDTNCIKVEQDKLDARSLAFHTQLAEPELVFRGISFMNFVSTWLIRFIDPRHTHPHPLTEYVIPHKALSYIDDDFYVSVCPYLKMSRCRSRCYLNTLWRT